MSASQAPTDAVVNLRVRIHGFKIPPVQDGLVIGTTSPIGAEAMFRALSLLNGRPFERIDVAGDDVVGSILVGADILKRVPPERLTQFIRERVKPHMSSHEVIHLAVEAELLLEGQV